MSKSLVTAQSWPKKSIVTYSFTGVFWCVCANLQELRTVQWPEYAIQMAKQDDEADRL